MPWEVTPTILTAVFGSTILVFLLWGIHARLLPHLRHPSTYIDTTIPISNRVYISGPTSTSANHHRLRSSLYSLPSPNYIDPRNSIADTELMSSRWSTSIHDLDSPTSPRSPLSVASPRSCRSGTATPVGLRSGSGIVSPRPRSLMSVLSPSPAPALPRSPCIHFSAMKSTPNLTNIPRTDRLQLEQTRTVDHHLAKPEYRKRSQSDSLLERSHAALYGYDSGCKRDISRGTGLSGTTLGGTPTLSPASASSRVDEARSSAYTANTSKIRSYLPR